MPRPKLLRLAALLVFTASVASCIDSEEEVWLNKNGSGRAEITLTVPKAVFALQGGEEGVSELVDKLLGYDSSVSNITTDYTKGRKRVEIITSFRFESATKLYQSLTDATAHSDVPGAI